MDVGRLPAFHRCVPRSAWRAFARKCKLRCAGDRDQLRCRHFGRKNLSWGTRLATTVGGRGARLHRCDTGIHRSKVSRSSLSQRSLSSRIWSYRQEHTVANVVLAVAPANWLAKKAGHPDEEGEGIPNWDQKHL